MTALRLPWRRPSSATPPDNPPPTTQGPSFDERLAAERERLRPLLADDVGIGRIIGYVDQAGNLIGRADGFHGLSLTDRALLLELTEEVLRLRRAATAPAAPEALLAVGGRCPMCNLPMVLDPEVLTTFPPKERLGCAAGHRFTRVVGSAVLHSEGPG